MGSFAALYGLLPGIETTRSQPTLRLFAILTFVIPIALAAVASWACLLALHGRWGTRLGRSAVIAGLVLGVAAVPFVPFTSAVNDCKFNVALPLPSYRDACD